MKNFVRILMCSGCQYSGMKQKMLEKILIRGNEEGVWKIRDPHMRAYSYIFAMFGLAEATEVDTEMMKQEIREITKFMLQIEIPGEKVRRRIRMSVRYTIFKKTMFHIIPIQKFMAKAFHS